MLRPRIALVLIAVGAASLLSGPAGGAPRPACKDGQAVWRIQGKPRCVTVVKPRLPATQGSRVELITQRLLFEATRPLPKGRTTRLTRGMRRMLTRGPGNAVLTAVRRTETLVRTRASASRAQGGASKTVTAPPFAQKLGNTTMTGTGSATVSDSGDAVLALGLRLAEGNASTEMKVTLEMEAEDDSQLCPDASGKIVLERRSGGSLTNLVRKGGNVESAETTRVRTVTRTVGQVGSDGVLRSVTSEQTSTVSLFRRGLRMEIVSTSAVTGAADTPGQATGTPSAKAEVQLDGVSPAEARRVEQSLAAKVAADATAARTEATISDRGRADLRDAAKNWETADGSSNGNRCLKVAFTPPTAVLKTGQSLGVTAAVTLRNGGATVPATWEIVYVGAGQFTGGAGNAFTAIGGESNTEFSVAAAVVGSSVAGRVWGTWVARRLPSYKVEFTASGTANTATHDATAKLSGTLFTVAQEGSDPPKSAASGPVTWSDIVFTPKIECSYINPVSGGTWGTTVTSLPDGTIRVTWTADDQTKVDASVHCPGSEPVAGQPGPRPLGMEPVEFILPASGGTQAISGSVTHGSSGFHTNGTITVTPNA